MPTDGPALPHPKAASTRPGRPRRYRRKVAGPKQWQKIVAEKTGPCRACVAPASNGHDHRVIELHHLVARDHFGDDVPDNLVPLHRGCHREIHDRTALGLIAAENMLRSLTDAEYAYMVARGGEGYSERAYGLVYERPQR